MHQLAIQGRPFQIFVLVGGACGLLASGCYFDPSGFHPPDTSSLPDQSLVLIDGLRPPDGPTPPVPDTSIPRDQRAPDREPVPDKGPPAIDQARPVDLLPTPDLPPPPDLKPPTPDQKPPPASCAAIFTNTGIPGYVLCQENTQSCFIYYAASQNTSCDTICAKGGRTCWGMYNTNPPNGCDRQGLTKESCSTGRQNALCVCLR